MKKRIKRCKHGHPLEREGITLLGHVVGVCHNCGHRYLYSSIPAVYSRDVYNSLKERFHIYNFVCWMLCAKCHSTMISIQISCQSPDDHEASWVNELKDGLGIMLEEKKDENICCTSDKQPELSGSDSVLPHDESDLGDLRVRSLESDDSQGISEDGEKV